MSLYEQIRKVHEREQLGIRQLSRRFGVHRRDVRQALQSAVSALSVSARKRIRRWLPGQRAAVCHAHYVHAHYVVLHAHAAFGEVHDPVEGLG